MDPLNANSNVTTDHLLMCFFVTDAGKSEHFSINLETLFEDLTS